MGERVRTFEIARCRRRPWPEPLGRVIEAIAVRTWITSTIAELNPIFGPSRVVPYSDHERHFLANPRLCRREADVNGHRTIAGGRVPIEGPASRLVAVATRRWG